MIARTAISSLVQERCKNAYTLVTTHPANGRVATRSNSNPGACLTPVVRLSLIGDAKTASCGSLCCELLGQAGNRRGQVTAASWRNVRCQTLRFFVSSDEECEVVGQLAATASSKLIGITVPAGRTREIGRLRLRHRTHDPFSCVRAFRFGAERQSLTASWSICVIYRAGETRPNRLRTLS
jgi:hypothetical protein